MTQPGHLSLIQRAVRGRVLLLPAIGPGGDLAAGQEDAGLPAGQPVACAAGLAGAAVADGDVASAGDGVLDVREDNDGRQALPLMVGRDLCG